MADFSFTCGIPASGKSTFANSLKEAGMRVYSSDETRKNHPDWDNNAVFTHITQNIISDLKAGHDCLMDSTCVSRKDRMRTINNVRRFADRIICHLFITPIDICIQRNNKREDNHGVDDTVIWKMVKRFQPPWYGEYIHKIEVHPYMGEFDQGYTREQLMSMEQNNPHHTLTVGEHEKKAEEYIDEHCVLTEMYPFLKYAARFHDDGKFFTKVFTNTKGEPTDIAHFYNHENVGAYLFLTKAFCTDELDSEYEFTEWGKLYIANLIVAHMRPNVWKESEKAQKKDTDILGELMTGDLQILNAADLQAK